VIDVDQADFREPAALHDEGMCKKGGIDAAAKGDHDARARTREF
jgi:hypothetical protein